MLRNVLGGLTGPAIRPVSLHQARRCIEAVSIPVIGCGGIAAAEDALEFLCIGCRAIQVGTASFRDPRAIPKILAALGGLLTKGGWSTLESFVGSYRPQH